MSSSNDSLCERALEGEIRYFTVGPPVAHEGVGRALRSIYRRQADDVLPPEMIDLLNRLDDTRREPL